MHRTFVISFVIMLALVSSGCVKDHYASDTPSSPARAEGAAERPQSDEQSFLDLARQQEPSLEDVADGALIDAGWAVCDALDSGIGFNEIVATSTNAGASAAQAGTIMGSAVYNFCPAHLAAAERWSS
jgi:Protein of unknown function (DUF732)